MNYRTLKNGKQIEEPKFQELLTAMQVKRPTATELDLLTELNTPAPPKARTPKPAARKPGRVG